MAPVGVDLSTFSLFDHRSLEGGGDGAPTENVISLFTYLGVTSVNLGVLNVCFYSKASTPPHTIFRALISLSQV